MLINGEKFACEACVRGHRVSSCTHHGQLLRLRDPLAGTLSFVRVLTSHDTDRKLLHVNKKGRPVSQCQHCRSLRKARSQHVKCECHDKAHAKEDCPHLKTESGILALESISGESPSSNKSPEVSTCCCGHGARCTCSLKKDHLDTVPEDIAQILQPKEPHKHRISSLNNHEGKPTIFTNGHHKPVHKINDAHNHCGAPYRVPSRSHTVHGHKEISHREIAQRSTDSLPTMKPTFRHTDSPLHTSITSAPREVRKAKSEHNSPELGPVNPATENLIKELFIPPLSPNAYSYSPYDCHSPTFQPPNSQELHLPETIPDSWFTTYDEAHAFDGIPAAGFNDTPPVDWSSFDFRNNNSNGNSNGNSNYGSNTVSQRHSYSAQPEGYFAPHNPSYASALEQLNFAAIPRMNSSSGEISEAEDCGTFGRPSNLRTVSNASNDISSPGDDFSENHRLSSASSFFGTPQANLLAGHLDNLDIDEYVKQQTMASQKRMNSQSSIKTHGQIIASPASLADSSRLQESPQHPQSSPLKSEPSPPLATKTSMGYIMPVNPYGPEHAFTISEAQAYAHMSDNHAEQLHQRTSPLARTSLTEDPMWSGTADGATAFKLDDPREDEDWVR